MIRKCFILLVCLQFSLFAMAQKIRLAKQQIYNSSDLFSPQARYAGNHTYSGKIFCACCGKPYRFTRSDAKQKVPIYRLKLHSDCENNNNRIDEADVDKITRRALQETIGRQTEICTELLNVLQDCVKSASTPNNLESLRRDKSKVEAKIARLLDELTSGNLTEIAKPHVENKINELSSELVLLTEEINEKEGLIQDENFVQSKMAEIKAALSELLQFRGLNREQILNYVEMYTIDESGDINLTLKTGKAISFAIKGEENTYPVKMRNRAALC